MARMIDADALQIEIASLSRLARSYAQKSLMGRVLYIIDQMPTIPATQWISVEERLPERNGTYIATACDEGEPYDEIIWNDTVVVCAEYYKGCWTWEENSTEYSLDGIVTHWMPMPEPPEEVRDDGAHIEPQLR